MPLSFYDVFPDTPHLTIVDVGAANIGADPTYQPLLVKGLANVVAFEPHQEACDLLNASNARGLRAFPYFVGDGLPGIFHQTNKIATASLLPPNLEVIERYQHLGDVMKVETTFPVQTTRIDDMPEVGDFDYLKIDVQGAEMQVLHGCQQKLLSCLVVEVEVSFVELYSGQPLFAEIDTFLRSQGFHFHRFGWVGSRCMKPAMVHGDPASSAFQWLWSDAIYVRDLLGKAIAPEHTLMKQAAIMNDIIGSFDYSVAILTELDKRNGGSRAQAFVQHLQNAA